MKKILVIGSGGAGKSTFARRLGEILQLEIIHLDARYWQSGWMEPPKSAWQAEIAQMVQRDEWIMDGNYSGTLALRLAACDTAIFLDLPRLVCLWRVLKRTLKYRNQSRPDMAGGCPEQFNWAFLLWVWSYPKRTRPKILALLNEHCASEQVVRLRSSSEVRNYLARIAAERLTS